MQKKNKIMLKAVAILLSLVLITTCIVSSTFAKFVIQKSTKTEMTLEAYGVTLDLDVAQALKNACTVEEKVNGNSLTVTLTNLTLAPGDDFSESIIFALSGAATTRTKLNVDIDVEYDISDFYIDPSVATDDIDDGSYCEAYFPITLDVVLNDESEPTQMFNATWVDLGLQSPEAYIFWGSNGFRNRFGFDNVIVGHYNMSGNPEKTPTDLAFERVLGVGDAPGLIYREDDGAEAEVFDTFKFGFHWDFGESDKASAIDTWLMNQQPTFSITYVFSLEQVNSTYEPTSHEIY